MPALPDEIVTLQNKPYILFKGLLRMAHDQGFVESETQIVQVPHPDNGRTAVVTVTAVFREGETERRFTCVGDAGPDTTKITAYLRMAETRALSRCFRVALNVGETAFEELPDDMTERPQRRPRAAAAEGPPQGGPRTADPFQACGYEGCGVILTPAQAKLSQAKYHADLCPVHQRVMDSARTG